MATVVRAINDMRSSPKYSPGDFVISTESLFIEFEPKVLDARIYDSKIQVVDYMNLHPYIFEQKYGFPKPEERVIDWGNKVYLLLDYNARSKKWSVFQCPEFMMRTGESGVDVNSWSHLPEENILTQVEPIVVNHPVSRWWLIEDLEKDQVVIKDKDIIRLYYLNENEMDYSPENVDKNNLYQQLCYLAYTADSRSLDKIPSILLNDNFEGGGSIFHDGITEYNSVGSGIVHCGMLDHGGKEITKGERYILVCFSDIIIKN